MDKEIPWQQKEEIKNRFFQSWQYKGKILGATHHCKGRVLTQ
jgi:hypothetical protein